MKFLTLAELLHPCMGQGWAVGAFDTCNHEITRAIVDGAIADRAPVIIMVYPNHTPLLEWPALIRDIEFEVERTHIPAALMLDHARTLEQIEAALELGFSGVMIDASLSPLEENIAITRKAVELAHVKGASVEAELGHVGVGMEVIGENQQLEHLTRVEEAERFINETDVDALAVSIGTLHGLYRGKPHLDFERLSQLRAVCKIPLVLHGGSDTPDQDLRQAVEMGIAKINIWTDVRIPYLRALRGGLDEAIEKIEVHEVFNTARAAAVDVIRKKNKLFGSIGKANQYKRLY
jgi:fructose-bisphosphate aldolase, class II